MYEAIAPWVAELGLTAPQIGNNGADVVDPSTGRRLANQCLTPATVSWLLDRGEELGFVPVLFSGPRVLARARTPDALLIERNHEYVQVMPAAELCAPSLAVEKLLYLSLTRADELAALRDRLRAAAAGQHEVRFTALITECGILNFCDPAATKLQAVVRICGILGCALAEVIADGQRQPGGSGGGGHGRSRQRPRWSGRSHRRKGPSRRPQPVDCSITARWRWPSRARFTSRLLSDGRCT
jgi:hydroxymethylpyrimidine pyrophosphatase-like HAD family hydrolase